VAGHSRAPGSARQFGPTLIAAGGRDTESVAIFGSGLSVGRGHGRRQCTMTGKAGSVRHARQMLGASPKLLNAETWRHIEADPIGTATIMQRFSNPFGRLGIPLRAAR
jgi:hypothetical protein